MKKTVYWMCALLTYVSLPCSWGGTEETTGTYDLYIYHALAHRVYSAGSAKKHGYAKAFSYVQSVSAEQLQQGVKITYYGVERRNIWNGTVCEDILYTSQTTSAPIAPAPPTDLEAEAPEHYYFISDHMYNDAATPVNIVAPDCTSTSDWSLIKDSTSHAALGIMAVKSDVVVHPEVDFVTFMTDYHDNPAGLSKADVEQAMEAWLEVEGVQGSCGGNTYVVNDVVLNLDGEMPRLSVSDYIRIEPPQCAVDCSTSGSGITGQSHADVGSVAYRLDVGAASPLTLHTVSPVTNYKSADVLRAPVDALILAEERLPGGELHALYVQDEVLPNEGVLTIVNPTESHIDGSTTFTIKVYKTTTAYDPHDATHPMALVTDPGTTLRSTTTIKRVDADGKEVEITTTHEHADARNISVHYRWEEDIDGVTGRDGWTFTEGMGQADQVITRRSERVYSQSGADFLEEITWKLKGTHPSPVEEVTREEVHYQKYTPETYTSRRVYNEGSGTFETVTVTNQTQVVWKPTLMKSGTGASPRETVYSYYQDTQTPETYGKLQSITYPDGNWIKYTYDSQGRVSQEIQSYQDNDFATESAASLNRVTEYDYSMVSPAPPATIVRSKTVTRKIQGTIIGKTYHLYGKKGYKETIRAYSNSGAVNWNDNQNLREVTFATETYGTEMRLHTNGTITRTVETEELGGGTTMEVFRGITADDPVTAGSVPTKGQKSLRTVDADGVLLTNAVYYVQDAQTEIKLREEKVTMQDDYGRPLSRIYLDGSTQTTTYTCCGIGTVTDRNGVITTYSYDNLGRRIRTTRSGVTTHTEYDEIGRVRFTYQTPATNFSQILGKDAAAPEYNDLGELTKRTDPAGRETLYSRQVVNGIITETTTLPGGATRIETRYADGTRLSSSGTAQPAMSYQESWDVNGQRIIEQAYTTNTNEFTRTTADFLGRTVKTERPSPTGTGLATTIWEYEAGTGRLLSSTNADGLETLYLYNDEGEQVTSILDVDGDEIIDYAGMDRITTNAVEMVSTSTLPTELLSLTNQYTHVRQTRSWSYTQDNTNSVSLISESWSTPDGLRSWNRSFGNLSSAETVRDAANQTLTRTQTASDGSYTVSLSVSNRTDTVTRYRADGTQLSRQTYGYDAWNRVSTVTDAGTGDTTTTYHVDGSAHTVTNALTQVTATVTSGLNGQAYAPDGGRIETVTAHDGGVVTRTYNAKGELIRQEGARTYTSEYTYDYAGRMTKLITWRDEATGPGQETQWVYNDAGMLITKIYDDSTQISYTYDVAGRLKTRTWARGELTTYHYDALGQLITVDYADVNTPDVTQSYDRLGRMTSITDGSGTRSYSYDPTHLALTLEEYTAGLHAGRKLERGYDALERPSLLTLEQGTNTLHQVEYGYEAGNSRLSTVQGHAVSNRYAYVQNRAVLDTLEQRAVSGGTLLRKSDWTRDAGNRMENIHNSLSTTNQVISTYAYAYTAANQVDTITLKDGTWWDYGYDDYGQVTSGERKGLTGGSPATLPSYTFGYAFDDIGNRISATEGTITTQYQANALNQYSQITYPDAKYLRGEVAVGTTSIEVNKQPATDTAGFNLLLWSSLQGLVNNESDFYIKAMEGAGPPKVEKRLALIPTGTLAPSYDLDGNLLQDALWDYEWNAENRLVKQTHRNDLPLDLLERLQLEFVYDSQGRRVKKTVSTWNGSSFVQAQETLFLYDGWNLLAEIDSSSQTVVRSYTWGMDLSGSMQGAGGVGGLLSVEKGADVFLPSYDHNGNITAYSDASGSVVAKFEYDPFGRLLRETGEHAEDVVHRFSTKYQDSESGYYYYGFRYYDPETGRWLNRDPIEEEGGYNLHAHVNNDAINSFDFLGLITVGEYINNYNRAGVYDLFIQSPRQIGRSVDLFDDRVSSDLQDLTIRLLIMNPGALDYERHRDFFENCIVNEARAVTDSASAYRSAYAIIGGRPLGLGQIRSLMQRIWRRNIPSASEMSSRRGSVDTCQSIRDRIELLEYIRDGYDIVIQDHQAKKQLMEDIKSGENRNYSYLTRNWRRHRENFRGAEWSPQDFLNWFNNENESVAMYVDGKNYLERLINLQRRLYRRLGCEN